MDELRSVSSLLPAEHEGATVVGALVDDRVVSLAHRVPAGARPLPLTTQSWMGRDVFRRSAGLLFLEAAARAGRADLAIGPSSTRAVAPRHQGSATPVGRTDGSSSARVRGVEVGATRAGCGAMASRARRSVAGRA